jgi:hypothetical protein
MLFPWPDIIGTNKIPSRKEKDGPSRTRNPRHISRSHKKKETLHEREYGQKKKLLTLILD